MSYKVLVTGAEGFIGKHFCQMLKHHKIPYLGMDKKSGGDILTAMSFPAKITHVIHFAALKTVSLGETRPYQFIETNIYGTQRILEWYPDARIVNISSSAAEECKSIYGITKRTAELLGDRHAKCLNVRLYNVFGEGQSLDCGAVVPKFLNCKHRNERPVVYGDGEQMRDFTYVGDVVAELYRLLFHSTEVGLAHVGYSHPMSVYDLVRLIFGNIEPIYKPARGFEIVYSCSPTQMRQQQFGVLVGLKKTEAWWENEYRRTKN